MKVKVGDTISCVYGVGEVIAITNEYCMFVDEATHREYAVDIEQEEIYKYCDEDTKFIPGYDNMFAMIGVLTVKSADCQLNPLM